MVEEQEKPITEPFTGLPWLWNGEILHETYAQNALDARLSCFQFEGESSQESADILPSDGHNHLTPYFAQPNARRASRSWTKAAKPVEEPNVTKMISEDPGDPVMPAPEWLISHSEQRRINLIQRLVNLINPDKLKRKRRESISRALARIVKDQTDEQLERMV